MMSLRNVSGIVLLISTLVMDSEAAMPELPSLKDGNNGAKQCNSSSSRHDLRILKDVVGAYNLGIRMDSRRRTTLEKLTQFIMTGHDKPLDAIVEVVQVVMLRLGLYTSLRKCLPPHSVPPDVQAGFDLSRVVERIITRTFNHNNTPATLTSQILVSLTKNMISASEALRQCCQRPNIPTPICVESLHIAPFEKQRAFDALREMYNPREPLDPVCNKDKYLVSAYEHRLECFDDNSLEHESRQWEHGPLPLRKSLQSNWVLLVLKNILYDDEFKRAALFITIGVPLRNGNNRCPLEDIDNLFRKYNSHQSHDLITQSGLQDLLNDLDHITDTSTKQSKRGANSVQDDGNNNAEYHSDLREQWSKGSNPHLNHNNDVRSSNHNRDPRKPHYGNGGQSIRLPGLSGSVHDDRGGHGNNNHHPPSHNSQNGPGNGNGHEFIVYSGGSYNYNNISYTNKCLTANDLLTIHGVDGLSWYNPHVNAVNMLVFRDMCPTILNQLLTGACRPDGIGIGTKGPGVTTGDIGTTAAPSLDRANATSNVTDEVDEVEHDDSIDTFKTYLYSSLAVLVISLCSLTGALFIKLSHAAVKTYLMASMLSLAVGCLIADAILHLLPEVLEGGGHASEDEGALFNCNLKRLCVLLASLYGFFVLELLLSGKHGHSHHGDTDSNPDSDIARLNQVLLKYIKPLKETNVTMNNELHRVVSNKSSLSSKSNEESGDMGRVYDVISNIEHRADRLNTTEHHADGVNTLEHRLDRALQERELGRVNSQTSYKNEMGANYIKPRKEKIKPVAWMIIIGDCIHNFADGLAIGAAFSLSFTKGLSTSITVLCHEVPHELGDFAVLIDSGLSIRKAMILNFLSSLTAFAGLYAGLSIGSQEEATKWIFAVGTGLFLYVALTDLVPECKDYFRTTRTVTMFVAQNVGLLLGVCVMLLLAVYEDRMEIKLD